MCLAAVVPLALNVGLCAPAGIAVADQVYVSPDSPLAASPNALSIVEVDLVIEGDACAASTMARGTTLSLARLLMVVPKGLVKTARYRVPFWSAVTSDNESVVVVADGFLLMLMNVFPPSVLDCHCTDGAGELLTIAVNVAPCPMASVEPCG